MKLVLDGIIASLQKSGGISVYFRELLQHLDGVNQEAALLLEQPTHQDYPFLADGCVRVTRRQSRLIERYRPCRLAPDLGGVFFSSYYRLPASNQMRTVVVVHDFIYELFRTGPGRWVHVQQKHAAIKAADAIICISEATRQDLLQWVGVRPNQVVHVIHNGVSEIFRPTHVSRPERPFMLYVGARAGYKNFRLAVAALDFLPDLELHCVGGGALTTSELNGISDARRSRVKHRGLVTDDQLNILYNQAVSLVYPSSYEGFGIPVVEAMRAGCPVIAIDCKAVIEVGGDALIIAPEASGSAIADAVMVASSRRDEFAKAGSVQASSFSWRQTHSQTLDVLRSLA